MLPLDDFPFKMTCPFGASSASRSRNSFGVLSAILLVFSSISSRALTEIFLDFPWSCFGNFFRSAFKNSSRVPGFFFPDPLINSSAISPAVLPEFLQQFLRYSSSNSPGAPPGIPEEFLQGFFQSFSENFFSVPTGIPPRIFSKFLQPSPWSSSRKFSRIPLGNPPEL